MGNFRLDAVSENVMLCSGGIWAENNLDTGSMAHGISEVNRDSIWYWARGHLCDILVKNLASFYCVLRTPKKFGGESFKHSGYGCYFLLCLSRLTGRHSKQFSDE